MHTGSNVILPHCVILPHWAVDNSLQEFKNS